jgi:hypothetical protein
LSIIHFLRPSPAHFLRCNIDMNGRFPKTIPLCLKRRSQK